MPRIVISEFMDEGAVARLSAIHSTVYDPELVDQSDRLAELLSQAEVLIVRNRTQVRTSLLNKAPKLTAVGRLGVGLDNIDLAECEARGITVWPATGANDLAVAEYVIAMTMVLLRGAYLSSEAVISGTWPRSHLIGKEVSGKVMGLVGLGAIARQVAVRAAAMGMNVIAYDPHLSSEDQAWARVGRRDFDELLKEADVVSVHVPLAQMTRHLIDESALQKIKPGAVLINAARGGVVDETALIDALRNGRIGGAALDVFEVEPLGPESGARFANIPNLILTPHIAGVTEESNIRVSDMIATRVLEHLSKEN